MNILSVISNINFFNSIFINSLFFFLIAAICIFWFFRKKPCNPNYVQHFFSNFCYGGHRGSPLLHPENTLISMTNAIEEEADLIEFDVSMTKDNVPILLHDDTLDRTTNFSGNIRDYTLSSLAKCNFGAKFLLAEEDPNTTNRIFYKISTVKEVISLAKSFKIKMLFDVKDSDTILINKLNEMFEADNIYNLGIISSFFPTVVYKIKSRNPKILTGLTWRRWFFTYSDLYGRERRHSFILKHWLAIIFDIFYLWCVQTWLPAFLGVDMILTERSEISEYYVRKQEKAKRKVCAWTVNDENEMIWMNKCLSIPFLTDKPFLAKKIGLVRKT